MNVVGVGIDILDLVQMRKVLCGKAGKRFIENTFTQKEIECAGKNTAKLAADFAAKEAVYKAFGTGWLEGKDVELLRDAKTGAPRIRLYGKIAAIARKMKIKKVLVSLSHSKTAATAIAILTS